MTRRSFALTISAAAALRGQSLPPVRRITSGPKFHWFGYYDKLQFDPESRRVLGMQVDFEHRSPRPNDVIQLGVIDTGNSDKWTEIGESRAWCWQQGCMLQWIPGSSDEVIWNDRDNDHFISVIYNIKTGKRRTLPMPIYALAPDGKTAITTDFRRLNDTRPGYGYQGVSDPNYNILAPTDSGIWRTDLQSGKSDLIVPLREVAKIPYEKNLDFCKHWFNHLLVSPDSKRFIFLHRWLGEYGRRSFGTRLFTAGMDGKNLYCTDPYGGTSHFIWRDPKTILAWAYHPSHGNKFYLYEDRTKNVSVIGPEAMPVNGHCTYLPGNRWILNDTYPDKDRNQNVYLYEVATGKRVPLGSFHSPAEYTGEWRCDTHPRFSPDGKKVVIDSPHEGGRQMYLIDVSGIVG